MKHWKVILGVVLVFVLGAGAGALVTHRIYQKRLQTFLRGGPAATEMIVRRMSLELDLRPEQRRQLAEIVRDTQRQLREARQRPDPQFRQIFQAMEQRIRAILTPEQQTKFDTLMAERKAKWQMLLPPLPNREGHRFRGGPSSAPRPPAEPQP
jgi:uncharacterized protein YneF (UPF0154 family)